MEKSALAELFPLLARLPFSAERGMMTTLHKEGEGVIAFVKGAPERVLARCVRALDGEAIVPVDSAAVLAELEALAAEGLRVLAFGVRRFPWVPDPLTPEEVERDLTFVGLAGLHDPARPEARALPQGWPAAV
jgi:Ca2+-transporting ATPase